MTRQESTSASCVTWLDYWRATFLPTGWLHREDEENMKLPGEKKTERSRREEARRRRRRRKKKETTARRRTPACSRRCIITHITTTTVCTPYMCVSVRVAWPCMRLLQTSIADPFLPARMRPFAMLHPRSLSARLVDSSSR